jgi:hypothetical protein
MKYKVGDKVRVKSFEWYKANKNDSGDVTSKVWFFTGKMIELCGKEFVISDKMMTGYIVKGMPYVLSDEMIECRTEQKKWYKNKEVPELGRMVKIKTAETEYLVKSIAWLRYSNENINAILSCKKWRYVKDK